MKDDLARLQKADPATYDRFCENDIFQVDDFRRDAILQAVLQEAISSARWEFRVETTDDGFGAFIGKPKGTNNIQYGEMHHADSPAAALLAAYLASIEKGG
jgi:hypothetical protein